MNERLVYTEIESVTEEMRNDKRVLIISDNALFMVTTKTNSKWYNHYFESVPAEAIAAYVNLGRIGLVRCGFPEKGFFETV